MQYRTVVEEDSFVNELDYLKEKYPNIYDVKDAITWELCRRPEAYDLLPNESKYRVFDSLNIGYTPTFRVLYRYDPNDDPRVFLLSIAPADTEMEE